MPPRFLVSTTHDLLVIDVETDQLWRAHSGSGLYYGLAKDGTGLTYVACRNTVAGPDDEVVREAEVGTILVLDPSFRVVEEIQPPFPMRDVHGIACFDDRLWVTCSFDNMIAIYGLRTRDWSRWFPSPSLADRGRDVHHFNTIRKIGGEICLTAHHFGPSELLFFDCATLQLNRTVSIGSASHNIFLLDKSLATCSSGDGWLANIGGKKLRTGNFPRGVATTAEGNLLGLSMVAGRAHRGLQDGILRWYTPNWSFRRDYVLPRVGMVLDIMELEEGAYDWQGVESWPYAEVTRDKYNRVAPGNRYAPNSFVRPHRNALEWHEVEETHCWTAAKRATLCIVINSGETRLLIDVGSSFPHTYSAEIRLDEALLGTARFSTPTVQQLEFSIPAGFSGPALLSFNVPHLWRPAEVIAGSNDERLLGLAVCGVTVDL
jgi:hypothetical protein